MVNGNVPIKKSRSSLSTFISEQWEIYRKHFRRNQNCPSSNDRSELCVLNSSCYSKFAPTISNPKTLQSKRTFVVSEGSDSDRSSRTRFICKTDGYYDIYKSTKAKPMINTTQDAYYYERGECPILKSNFYGCNDDRIKQIQNRPVRSNSCVAGCGCSCATQDNVKCTHKGCPGNSSQKKKKKKGGCQCCAKNSESDVETGLTDQCVCVQKNNKKDDKKRKKDQAKKLKKAQKKCHCVPPCLAQLHLQKGQSQQLLVNEAPKTPASGGRNYAPCPVAGGANANCNYRKCSRCFCKQACQNKTATNNNNNNNNNNTRTAPKIQTQKSQSQISCNCPDRKQSKQVIQDKGAPPVSGITNSNTILLPKQSPSNTKNNYNCKETLESVRMMIKMESRQNYRNINNILNELKKQRKDIDDLKKICMKNGGANKNGTAAYSLYSQYPYKFKDEEHNERIRRFMGDNRQHRNHEKSYVGQDYTKMLLQKHEAEEKIDHVSEKGQVFKFDSLSLEPEVQCKEKKGVLKFFKKKKKHTYT